MSRDAAIGQYLATLRDKAEIKQGEMARMLGWSPAVLSRIESGTRPASSEELSALLSAIDLPEARTFPGRLARQWVVLPEPAFDEPDADLIWEAEQAAQRVRALAAQSDIKHFFARRLARYEEELCAAAERLADRRYRVVLSGAIAAGKSTAICRAEGLELARSKGMPMPVLETGRGGSRPVRGAYSAWAQLRDSNRALQRRRSAPPCVGFRAHPARFIADNG